MPQCDKTTQRRVYNIDTDVAQSVGHSILEKYCSIDTTAVTLNSVSI